MPFFKVERFPAGSLELKQKAATKVIPVELADRPFLWEQGLMYREDMPLEFGMLFVFPTITVAGFWMKNVLTPLSIAFINFQKTIIHIQDMPLCNGRCVMYYSPRPYRYALETRMGFFKTFGFSEGCKISYRV